jgi:uncharacterized protein (TIGR02145 family)
MKKIFYISCMLFLTACTKEKNDSFEFTGTVSDVDGNVYNTVTIGTQVWMAENLKVTRYRDGSPITVVPSGLWASLTTEGYCNYDTSAYAGSIYGGLYNYYAVTDPRSICPVGWHVPTQAEWNTLLSSLGETAGDKLREKGTQHWWPPNENASNKFGFTALPGGWRDGNAAFENVRHNGYFWSGTFNVNLPNEAWMVQFSSDLPAEQQSNLVQVLSQSMKSGCSIRCVKD